MDITDEVKEELEIALEEELNQEFAPKLGNDEEICLCQATNM